MHKKMDTGNQPVPISNENVGSEAVLESANIILGEENGGPPELSPVILLRVPDANQGTLVNYSANFLPITSSHPSLCGSITCRGYC
jgi:hypothetical protein